MREGEWVVVANRRKGRVVRLVLGGGEGNGSIVKVENRVPRFEERNCITRNTMSDPMAMKEIPGSKS